MYEIAVANLRGRGDMTAQSGLVADYFSDVAQHTSIGELIDAMVLLTYCFGGFLLKQFHTNEAELYERRENLIKTVGNCLSQPGIGPGRRSGLLRVRGGLELLPPTPGTHPDVARAFSIWHDMLDQLKRHRSFRSRNLLIT